MPELDRGIGSQGLEQGGPNLGNEYSRNDLSVGNAGDAFTTPNTTELKKDDDESLALDQESSRDLDDTEDEVLASDDELIDEDFDDEEDDEDFSDLDDEEDEDNELERGI